VSRARWRRCRAHFSVRFTVSAWFCFETGAEDAEKLIHTEKTFRGTVCDSWR
jgi:hypothetical protein